MRMALIITFLLATFSVNAQDYFKEHFGGRIGLVMAIGSHNISDGLNFNAFYHDHFYQFNAGSTVYFNEKSLGRRSRFVEARNALGVILLAGPKDKRVDWNYDALTHNTSSRYGIGYNYIFYNDNVGTSQNSGGFSIHLNQLSIYHENDVFAGQGKDRYRTGHLFLAYTWDSLRLGAGINLWTGETENTNWIRTCSPDTPYGYKLLEENQYGGTSHGIAYLRIDSKFPFGQIPHFQIGMDSEEIRHAFQNKLMHDLVFLPKKIERNTPHYPRVDSHGCATFDSELRRKDRIYLQLGINDNWSH